MVLSRTCIFHLKEKIKQTYLAVLENAMETPNQKYHPKGKFQSRQNKSHCNFFDAIYKINQPL